MSSGLPVLVRGETASVAVLGDDATTICDEETSTGLSPHPMNNIAMAEQSRLGDFRFVMQTGLLPALRVESSFRCRPSRALKWARGTLQYPDRGVWNNPLHYLTCYII